MTHLGSIAERVIEHAGSKALGVTVSIDNMQVSLKDRKAVVKGLSIANPKGFDEPMALSVESISVDLGNLSKGLVNLEEIEILGADVNMEVRQEGTNFQAIQEGMMKPAEVKEEAAAGDSDEVAEQMKVIIDKFALRDAKLHPSVMIEGVPEVSAVVVPDIVLTGIGKKENGVLAQEAIIQIWNQLSKRFSATAMNAGFYQGMDVDALKELGASQMEILKNKVSDGLDDVGSKIKGLFQ